MSFQKLNSFTKKVADLADRPSLDPVAIKAQFDAAPEELRQYFNNLVDDITTLLPKKVQEDWKPLVFQNGWVPAGSGDAEPKYMKDEFGFVHLKGTIWGGGGVLGDWTIITTLPTGYIPSERIRLPSVNTDETNTKACYVVVEPDGLVKIKNVSYAGKLELNLPTFRV